MNISEYREFQKGAVKKHKKAPKYRNKKVVFDGITFDSILERDHYKEYQLMLKSGTLKGYGRQVRYELQPGFQRRDGKRVRAITMVVDHQLTWPDGSVEAVDSKGQETDGFKLKRKMFEYRYPDIKFTTRFRNKSG